MQSCVVLLKKPSRHFKCHGSAGLGPWETGPLMSCGYPRLCTFAGPGGGVRGRGDLAFVCSRSAGSRRPSGCGKSPKVLAFAVPLWAKGH